MSAWTDLRRLSSDQRNAFAAAFLGWTLDAFDYFVLVFVIKDVARDFHTNREKVALALTLTLAMRPVGALIFGMVADRFGRRVPLMVDVILYSAIELLSGFAPTLTCFLVLRAVFGVAMGGEWGLGAALAMETVPAEMRGVLSGLLQEGYVVGYLLAAVVYNFVFPALGWRWMFFVGALPALLALFIRARVKESPIYARASERRSAGDLGTAICQNARLFVYLVVLMTAFNFMSHGSQDVYPTFLQVQRHFSPSRVAAIAIIYNIGALAGGIFFGSLSQRMGRRRAIIMAALLALPVIPLWAYAPSAALLAVGGFLLQFMVQGAWGVVPAHLSELSPNSLRGTFTGFAYQLGNLFAAINATLETGIAERHHRSYAPVLASVMVVVLICVAGITAVGPESLGAKFDSDPEDGTGARPRET